MQAFFQRKLNFYTLHFIEPLNDWLSKLTKDYGHKLASIHYWHASIVIVLALSGLILLGGFWREVLGEGRVWLKWLHVGGGAKGDFRVYSATPIPSFNNSNWSFTIDGLVDRLSTWNWSNLLH